MKPIPRLRHAYLRAALMLAAVIIFVTAGCASDVEIKKTGETDDIRSILVFPLKDIHDLLEEEAAIRSPLSGNTVMPGKVAEHAGRVMTERLLSLLHARKDLVLIPPGQGEGVMALMLSQGWSDANERDLLVEAARALDADAVIAGYIYRFEQRVGTNYSVERPAYVVFDLYLIRAADGEIVWGGYYEELQRSLSENLFKLGKFIKRGGKWVTAQEMALSALEDMMKTFPVN